MEIMGDYGPRHVIGGCPAERKAPVFPRDALGCGLRSATFAHEGGKVSHPSELQFSYWGAGNSPCLTVMT